MKFFIPLIVVLLLLLASVLFVEVWERSGVRSCSNCPSTVGYRSVEFYVFGARWQREELGAVTQSTFQKDFPQFHCDHLWGWSGLDARVLWDSPILHGRWPEELPPARNAIVEGYENRDFRVEVKRLIAEGQLTSQRLVSLAGLICMCRGICQIRRGIPGESELLELIERVERDEVVASEPSSHGRVIPVHISGAD